MPRTEPSQTRDERTNWRASWIWTGAEAQPRNAYLYARKTFDLKDPPETAKLRCSADSRYRVYVNGVYVGQGPIPSTPGVFYYDSYDINSLLVKGENCIGILAHHIGEGTYWYMPKRAGLICQLELDGELVATDASWKVLPASDWTSQGQRLSKRLGFQEVYDARLEPGTWNLADFYDGPWETAAVVGQADDEPWGRLTARQIPLLVEEIVRPRAIVEAYVCPPLPDRVTVADMAAFMSDEDLSLLQRGAAHNLQGLITGRGRTPVIHTPREGGSSIVLDFGREVTGHLEMILSGWGGAILDIGYSEQLEGGRIRPDKARMRYTDRYITRSGRQMWRSFGQRAFRYVQIDLRDCPRALGIEQIRVAQPTQPAGAGAFDSSDKLLNDIWFSAAYTARLSMQETFIDCLWRERAQWWSDARVTSHVAYYTSGDHSLLRQGIRQIAASQREDGSVLGLYPASVERLIPDYAALWILSVWEHYAWTGDKDFLAEVYPAVTRCLEWFRKFARTDGLAEDVPGDIFIDWGAIEKRGVVTGLNCLYYEALHRTGQMAAALERSEDAEAYESSAGTVRYAINRHLWSPPDGLYVDSRWDESPDKFSAQTNILAVLFDIPDHYRKAAICRQLLEPDWLGKLATPYFTSYFVEILCREGFYEEALDLIRKRWGGMLEAGATTFWERFTPDYSLCHAWSSGPARHLSAEFLGVRPVAGEPKVKIAPQPVDLKWARGLVPTPYGNVDVEWRSEARRFTIHVNVPEGMSAELVPPGARDAVFWLDREKQEERVVQVGPGSHEFRAEYRPERKGREPSAVVRQPEEAQVEIMPRGEALRETGRGRYVRRRREQPATPRREVVVETAPPAEQPQAERVEELRDDAGPRQRRRRRPAQKPGLAPPSEAPPVVQEQAQETKQESPAGEQPRRRSRRPRPAKSAEVQAEFRPVEPVESPTSQEPQPEEQKRRTRRRPPRRRPSDGGSDSQEASHTTPPEPAKDPPIPEVQTEPGPAANRRPRRRRRPRPVSSDEPSAPRQSEPEPD